MIDYASPAETNYRQSLRRPRRSLVFVLGVVFGILIGTTASYVLLSGIPRAVPMLPTWSSTLVCRGHVGSLYFVENPTHYDFVFADTDCVFFRAIDKGLVPCAARLMLPAIALAGQVTGVEIQNAPASGLRYFDLKKRVEIDLN